MLHRPYGPRGAESEDPEFWTDLTRNSDFLPEPGIVNPVLRSAQEPYTPADDHQDRQTIDDENLASHNDPLGSWTGVPDQADEMPTQDQDDL